MLHGQRLSLSAPVATAIETIKPSRWQSHRHGTMGVIADTFAALLADLKRQDEQSRRATQETINRANKLIADLETMDERWRAEDELI